MDTVGIAGPWGEFVEQYFSEFPELAYENINLDVLGYGPWSPYTPVGPLDQYQYNSNNQPGHLQLLEEQYPQPGQALPEHEPSVGLDALEEYINWSLYQGAPVSAEYPLLNNEASSQLCHSTSTVDDPSKASTSMPAPGPPSAPNAPGPSPFMYSPTSARPVGVVELSGAPSTQAIVRRSAKRTTAIACFFCRKRKIACGGPLAGSSGRTCVQCKRRNQPCEYPESRSNRHGLRFKAVQLSDAVEQAGQSTATEARSGLKSE
ncbi:uncharacterized protein C8Q71DRAFT_43961 [Rhodofomes roseus]|uniref:Zn(2)-C6 fungal-type domain-containing protein n=1 Tax=Rhodofomes roseus TaxID=34475 RepID=A0ABQ8KGR1_9APHY|nr:uncharacterized protein C8Q71DRAFT_43961 [Rhodofomes roseus]KAH9836479.1 hypothetical protein C8Q71DRAFT_43961 [Rhodofomes roseus]